jgi:5-methylthioadenosine/S-adenosylhomocysteine deaminase
LSRWVIRGATVLPLDGRRMLRKSDVLIDDGIIAAFGGVDTAGAMIAEVQGLLMPGLVQTHVHLDQTLLDRHFVPDTNPFIFTRFQLDAWLKRLDDEALRLQAEAAFARGLGTGSTTFADGGRGRGRSLAFEAAQKVGVRLVGCLDATQSNDVEKDFDLISAGVESAAGEGLVKVAIWGGDAERTPMARLKKAALVARHRSVPMFVHLGMLPGDRGGLSRLDRAGALNRHLVLCHATGASLKDKEAVNLLAEVQASVVLSPSFMLITGAPPPPLDELLVKKVNLALGSETNATRLHFDLFKELRLLYRMLLGRVDSPAATALEIATRNGAQALHMPIGTVTVGHPADLILVEVEAQPGDDYELVARRIIVQGEPSFLRTAWVNGQVVYKDGRVAKCDPPSDTAEEETRARLRYAEEEQKFVLTRALHDVIDRRYRLSRGWHPGKLPFLQDGTGKTPA